MKNLLSKSLLCGVLASSLLIVNCQKAPNRAVNAKVNPAAKPNAAKTAECSQAAIDESKSAREIHEALKVELDKVKDKAPADLTPEQKNNLTLLVNNLFAQSNKLIAEIQKITIGDKKEAAEACTEAGTTKAHDIKGIQGLVAALGKTVKDKTGLENDATKNAPAVEEALTAGQELSASKELADFLSDSANAKGVAVIVNGKIEKGDVAVAALKDVNATVCSSANDNVKAVAEKSTIKVISVSDATLDAASKRNVSLVGLEVKLADGTYGVILNCQIADKKEKAAAVQIRKALGALVSKVEVKVQAPAQQESADSTVASGDATQASGDSTAASADGTKAKATEALSILDNALSRK